MEEIWQPILLENTISKVKPLVATDFEKLHKVASNPLIW
jgi:hypothetical protein